MNAAHRRTRRLNDLLQERAETLTWLERHLWSAIDLTMRDLETAAGLLKRRNLEM